MASKILTRRARRNHEVSRRKTHYSVSLCETSVELCVRFSHEEHEGITKFHEEKHITLCPSVKPLWNSVKDSYTQNLKKTRRYTEKKIYTLCPSVKPLWNSV